MTDLSVIIGAVAPVVAGLGLELYDVEITGSSRARIVRVMIDRPSGTGEAGSDQGGVDLDAIAAATEAVSPVLDAPPVEGELKGPYSLEVSSPGLERPLRTPAHFHRAVGETVSVKYKRADDEQPGSTRVRGVVREAGDDSFVLLADDGSEATITYTEVVQARTVFEWGPKPKGAKQQPAGRKQEVVRR
jgi:ribosome maturation factor RimP